MADIADVEVALLNAVEAVFFPDGIQAHSTTQRPVRLYRGWPSTAILTKDRAAGVVDIGITDVPGTTRPTTRWGVLVHEMPARSSLAVTVLDRSATFSGKAVPGDLAGLMLSGKSYVCKAGGGDTAELVAAAIADLVRVDRPCRLTGATISVPGIAKLVARTASSVDSIVEWGRQETQFRLSAWASSPTARDEVASTIIQGLAPLSFLQLPDDTAARIQFHGAETLDVDQVASIYRRDLLYTIEFATTTVIPNITMLFGDLTFNGSLVAT